MPKGLPSGCTKKDPSGINVTQAKTQISSNVSNTSITDHMDREIEQLEKDLGIASESVKAEKKNVSDDILCEEYFCTFKDRHCKGRAPEQKSCYDEIENGNLVVQTIVTRIENQIFLKKFLRHGFANSLIREGHTEEQICPSHENEGKKCGSVAINDIDKLKNSMQGWALHV